jgi:hypothetical protein
MPTKRFTPAALSVSRREKQIPISSPMNRTSSLIRRLAATALITSALSAAAQLPPTLYVWQGSSYPGPPYASWETAAHTIQDALDCALPGDIVLVTNGVYAESGRAVHSSMTNRVVVGSGVELRSVNGPGLTVIVGAAAPGGTNGDGAIRCAYLGTNALLSGFTLTNGHTRATGDYMLERSGGGVWCEDSAFVTSCILTNNFADSAGGGACYGTLSNCTLAGNRGKSVFAWGGGAYYSTLNNCTLTANSAYIGGGAAGGTLNNCTLIGNYASSEGGGAAEIDLNNCVISNNSAYYSGGVEQGRLNNCILIDNYASAWGGGASSSGLTNCTLTRNYAQRGGGAFNSELANCIVYYNNPQNHEGVSFTHCCTTLLSYAPLPYEGNITNEPGFVSLADGNVRLRAGSPCIDAGSNACVNGATDLDGLPRIVGGVVDMGAYEFQGPGPLGPQLVRPQITNGHFVLVVSGCAGSSYLIETTTNWATWSAAGSVSTTTGLAAFMDTNTLQSCRAYRARLLP